MADLPRTKICSTLKKPKHQCNECSFITTRASYLKRHIEAKHEDIRYPCDQCEYSSTRAFEL